MATTYVLQLPSFFLYSLISGLTKLLLLWKRRGKFLHITWNWHWFTPSTLVTNNIINRTEVWVTHRYILQRNKQTLQTPRLWAKMWYWATWLGPLYTPEQGKRMGHQWNNDLIRRWIKHTRFKEWLISTALSRLQSSGMWCHVA
jgi:hypothetical protein